MPVGIRLCGPNAGAVVELCHLQGFPVHTELMNNGLEDKMQKQSLREVPAKGRCPVLEGDEGNVKKTTFVKTASLTLLVGVFVSTAGAAGGWHVFASGKGTGSYRAFAKASADVSRSHALAVRATSSPGKPVKMSISLNCEVDARVTSGTIVIAATSLFTRCMLAAEARTEYSGPLKVELLWR
jgi:hypothetical protein